MVFNLLLFSKVLIIETNSNKLAITLGVLKSSAQITTTYSIPEMIGRQVVAVVNFPVKKIADFNSQCLVLGATQGNDVFLLSPQSTVENGQIVR